MSITLEELDTIHRVEEQPHLYYVDLSSGDAGDIPKEYIDDILNISGEYIAFRTHGIGEREVKIYEGTRQRVAMEYEKMLDWYYASYFDRRINPHVDYITPLYRAYHVKDSRLLR